MPTPPPASPPRNALADIAIISRADCPSLKNPYSLAQEKKFSARIQELLKDKNNQL
jgi:hypothetical protein